MKKEIYLLFTILLVILNIKCSTNDNSTESTFKQSIYKKITINEGKTDIEKKTTIYILNYDTNNNLKTLEINGGRSANSYAKYTIEYNNNNQISRALLDCSESNCGWKNGISPSNYVEITFEYGFDNETNMKTISVNQNQLDSDRNFFKWITGEEYQINSNNQKE